MSGTHAAMAALSSRLGSRVSEARVVRDHEWHVLVSVQELEPVAASLLGEHGASLMLVASDDRRADTGSFHIAFHFTERFHP